MQHPYFDPVREEVGSERKDEEIRPTPEKVRQRCFVSYRLC